MTRKITRKEAIEQAKILKSLIEIAEANIINNTFVNAFLEKSELRSDGQSYLHGNFNLGGTISGRLSSSNINLQNLPSTGTKYAKLIKKCFQAPRGWVIIGADFSSLEDRISALTTKDPNKLKVYTDGYDGHSLRAYSYFREQMENIEDTVESINSIGEKYPKLRQYSKGPTFALTYQGTWHTLVNNLGLPEKDAKEIEKKYHELYTVSDQWVQDKLLEASDKGYVTVAFGLRIRTPILAKTILNKHNTPYEAAAEGRTVGNALGQSYGLLNNRAAIDLHNRLLNSEYKYDIKPISHIHDAQYFLVKKDAATIKWLNDNLIDCMQWQDLPEIQHDQVKLGGDLDIYIADWSDGVGIPNNASLEIISDILQGEYNG